jgi:hypothetical protein
MNNLLNRSKASTKKALHVVVSALVASGVFVSVAEIATMQTAQAAGYCECVGDWTLDIFRFFASQIHPLANDRRIDIHSCKNYDKLGNDRSCSFSRLALFYH